MFIIDSKEFLKRVHGKLDPVFAYTVGKLKVEGDLGKALEIQKLIKNNISKQKAGKPPAFSAIFDKLF